MERRTIAACFTLYWAAGCIGVETESETGAIRCLEHEEIEELDAGVPPLPRTFTGRFAVRGTVASSVAKGKYRRAGVEETTTDRQLEQARTHAAQYDGESTFDVVYSITVKADGKVDNAASTVSFQKITYSSSGTATTTTWATTAIPVTGASLNDKNELVSFTFAGPTWYSNAPGGIADRGISGSVNVESTATSYTAKYQSNSTGAIYTYVTTSPGKKPDPCPEPEEPGPDPVPGPAEYDIYEPLDPSLELEGK